MLISQPRFHAIGLAWVLSTLTLSRAAALAIGNVDKVGIYWEGSPASTNGSVSTSMVGIDPLPFPRNSRYKFESRPASLRKTLRVLDVYMVIAYGQYLCALRGPFRSAQGPFNIKDYSGLSDPEPYIDSSFIASQPPIQTFVERTFWFLEGLQNRVKVYKNTIKSHTIDFTCYDPDFRMFGHLEKRGWWPHESAFAVPPDCSENVTVTYRLNPRPVNAVDVMFAAKKAFRRVVVEAPEEIVPRNWGFIEGNVELIFGKQIGAPRVMTWRELAQGTMAMIQFMRQEQQGFREVKGEVKRDGVVVGIVETNVHEANRELIKPSLAVETA